MKKYEIVVNEVKYFFKDCWLEIIGLFDYMKCEGIVLIVYMLFEKGIFVRNECLVEIGKKYGKIVV